MDTSASIIMCTVQTNENNLDNRRSYNKYDKLAKRKWFIYSVVNYVCCLIVFFAMTIVMPDFR